MPDPSSGVAVVDGNLIEVKDAANGVGQTVKIKVTAVTGNIATAKLAEPLHSAQRRRRRGRGHGKSAVETEAPIAPPVPVPAARERGPREEPERAPAARAPRRSVPFGMEDDEEEDYTLRG